MLPKRIIKYVHSDYLLEYADKNPAVKNRATLTHELIKSYDLLTHLVIIQPKICKIADIRGFHSEDYVQKIAQFCNDKCKTTTTTAAAEVEVDAVDGTDFDLNLSLAEEYGLDFDCPTWPGLKEYVLCIAGATMTACQELCNSFTPDVLINWTGGWHHAHRSKAAGYCYVNDIVLGILVLRKRYQRIFYIDLDVHHGDGVEEAFETTKRVFTLSFHQHECGFYPGSGAAHNCGFGTGKGYAVNFPYKSGVTGVQFTKYFKRITDQIFDNYQPDVCVVQCGADAIVGDPLGGTNLTPNDLIGCLLLVLKRNLPTLLLGGGGYNFSNVSRYWTLVTAKLCNQMLNDDIPESHTEFLTFGPDYSLTIEASTFLNNSNKVEDMEKTAKTIEDNLLKYKVGNF